MKTSQEKKMFKHYLILLVVLCCPIVAFAQRDITGSVIDSYGEPVIGATVTVKGTATGTLTNANGTFNLKVPKGGEALVFSYLGMETVEIPFNRKNLVYKVVMKEKSIDMDEVVVIGYGTIARKDLTGSVATLSGKSIANIPISNTVAALTGRMAGVNVTTTDGAPDAEIQVRVRGGGSITQDNSPLYIVDGFPMDRISDISPNDIESIDILKDAASTAIYGARGANGVVIITTKSAQAGKTTINYNGYAQYKKVAKKYDVLDSYEFVTLQHELLTLKYGEDISNFLKIYGDIDDFDIYKNIKARDTQDEMYGRDAWGQSHNISINGGTDKTKFTASFTYLNEDAILLNSSFERFNANVKLNHQISRALKFDLSAYYSNAVTMGAGTSATSSTQIKNAVSFRPVTGRDTRGDINIEEAADDDIEALSELYDPVLLINQDYKKQKREELNVNTALSWTINKMFSWKSEFGIQTSDRKIERYYGPITYTGRKNAGKPVAEIQSQERPRWRTAHTLNFKLRNLKGIHSLSAVAGFEAMSEENRSIISSSRMFPEDFTPQKAFDRMQSGSTEYTITNNGADTRLASFFGRANYTLKDRYLFTATVRADGSTKFAPGNQWGIFPSAAFAWRISSEPFLKNVSQIDDMKIRLSYGEAGNNRIDNDMWRRTYVGAITSPVAGVGNVPNLYYENTSSTLINPSLKWETTITRNFGIDYSFFNNRLSGTIDFYWNTTKDLLLRSVVPASSGYNDQLRNIGQTSNRGFEFSITGQLVRKRNFSLTATLNFSLNRNKVDKLAGVDETFYRSGWAEGLRESDDFILRVGQPTGLIYGYVTDGFYQVDDYQQGSDGKWYLKEGIANSQSITQAYNTINQGAGVPSPGSLKLKKTTPVDPDNPDTYNITPDDRQIIGNTNPKHTGGLNLSAVYKNLDISLFFNWVYGNDVYNANKIQFTTQWKKDYYNMLSVMSSANRFRYMDDAGNKITDMEQLRTLNENATIWSPAMKIPVLHSWAIEDGSFLRLNNITIGYTLPTKWTKRVLINRCRVYCTVNNVFVWTKYSGFDPEVSTCLSTPLTPGVDFSSYPKARTFTLGANITF